MRSIPHGAGKVLSEEFGSGLMLKREPVLSQESPGNSSDRSFIGSIVPNED
jgi:hypothetical protein